MREAAGDPPGAMEDLATAATLLDGRGRDASTRAAAIRLVTLDREESLWYTLYLRVSGWDSAGIYWHSSSQWSHHGNHISGE